MAEDQPDEGEGMGDAAAEAFEALRAEVAQVRAALEAFPPALNDVKAPDYSPTLAAIAQSLEKMESHPALQLTPEGYRRQVKAATDYVREGIQTEMCALVEDIRSARVQLQQLGANLRARDQQDRWLLYAAGAGAALGVFLWVMMSGPIARRLPWDLAEKMAARTLGLDRWQAGQQLMASGRPQDWRRIVWAANLERDNREALQACRERPKTQGRVRCVITVPAEADRAATVPR